MLCRSLLDDGLVDRFAAARKRMPMVRIERDYRFEGPDGSRLLRPSRRTVDDARRLAA